MKRYALIGTGSRGYGLYGKAIVENFGECAQMCALLDPNPKRAAYVAAQLGNPPIYQDFDLLLAEARPDAVIITTVDQFHDEYVVRALDAGVNVICEKPMATTAEKCRAIFEAEQRTGARIAVTFNCRFLPHIVQLKRMLRAGVVGRVLNVDFEWMLDTRHGADYFRRWHSRMQNSGGLLVHKATHHFDIVNFLIEQDPVSVYALGSLQFYGGDRQQPHGERCLTCTQAAECAYAYDEYDNPDIQGLYLQAEGEDGYLRDRCIFDASIDIFDTMNLVVRYANGASMSYSLIAHSPYEGWKLSISGTEGRLETWEGVSAAEPDDPHFHIKVYDRLGGLVRYDRKRLTGLHGGSDLRMLDRLLNGSGDDPLGQCAGSREGAMSAMIGICANQSIRSGQPITVAQALGLSI